MTRFRVTFALTAFLAFAGCTATPPAETSAGHDPQQDLGLFWVKNAIEYAALTRQVYGDATNDLQGFIDDKSWTALPGQEGAENLPPAVILDVDETVVSNVDFQIGHEPPFKNYKLEFWDREHHAQPVPGVIEFVQAARDAGVTVFFLTNRPCELYEGETDPCPQKQTTLESIRELGIDVELEYLTLAREKPEWTREKIVRRRVIGETHRIIMVIGDDFGDFVPCARKRVVEPCKAEGTRASRAAALEEYANYWGNGWYILPNPMHGSWTSVR